MPSATLEELAKFIKSVSSLMFSINPAPKTGVGMRKLRLPRAASAAKSGCDIMPLVQVGASFEPAIVNRSCTPLSDLKRASRTGPSGVIKKGVAFPKVMICPLDGTVNPWPTVACGFGRNAGPTSVRGEVPPAVGCEWQEPQELLLNVG